MQRLVRSARIFCTGAIAASILFQHLGPDNDLWNMGFSSAAGLGTLLVVKKFMLLA